MIIYTSRSHHTYIRSSSDDEEFFEENKTGDQQLDG
jgi:hypothetical protein